MATEHTTKVDFNSAAATGRRQDRFQSVASSRAPRTSVPNAREWETHFPIGVYFGSEASVDQANDGGGGTTSRRYDANGDIHAIMTHQAQGLKTNGLFYGAVHPGNLQSWEDTNERTTVYDDHTLGGPFWLLFSAIGSTAGGGTGIENDFYQRGGVNQTYADAVTFATPIVANLQEHPSILAYTLGDDIINNVKGAAAVNMIRAFQDIDPYKRPATAVITDPTLYDSFDDADLRLAFTYRYPCGNDGTPSSWLPEGDFHRDAFKNLPTLSAGADWVDALRWFTSYLPSTCRLWLALQAHKTLDGGLRYPTVNEIRLQHWIAIGEGATGIFWFLWDGSSDALANGAGVGDSSRLDILQEISKCARRTTESTRQKLLRCKRITNIFTTSGGGNTSYVYDYTNAYVSTLYSASDSTHYVVVVNRSDSAANITITSGSLTGGELVDLETKTRYNLGATISFPAFDGKIFQYDPWYGVPKWDVDFSQDVETWWSTHPANLLSANYLAPGTGIKTHPRVFSPSSGTDLNAYLATVPDYSTISLAAGGTYDGIIHVTGRKGLHFVSANPNNKATMRGIFICGDPNALWYHAIETPANGIEANLLLSASNLTGYTASTQSHLDSVYAWKNQPYRDFLIRDINFVSDTLVWRKTYYTRLGNGTYNYKWDNNWENAPIWVRSVRDVCVERCTFSGYDHAADTPEGQDNGTPVIGSTQWHGGFLNGNVGPFNIWFRNNTCHAQGSAPSDNGWPMMFFLDGARGAVVADNVATDGVYKQSGCASFLTNDDFTQPIDGSAGGASLTPVESRFASHNVIIRNHLRWGGTAQVNYTGAALLYKDNVLDMRGTDQDNANLPRLITIYARTSRQTASGHRYVHTGHVVDGNQVMGLTTITTLIELQPDDGWVSPVPAGDVGRAGIVGGVTYKNNKVDGTLTSGVWIRAAVGQTHGADIIPNTDGGGNESNWTPP